MSVKRAFGHIVNVALFGVIIFLVVRSGSPVRAQASRWYEGWSAAAFLENAWNPSIATGSPLTSNSGSVVLVEFADYQCGFCGQQHEILESFLAANPAVGITFRHLPILGDRSVEAARAAICAEEQNHFLQMHAALFENDEWRTEENDWLDFAREVGIPDLRTFQDCLDSTQTEERLAKDQEIADRLNISGTPGFANRTRVHKGMLSAEELAALIQAQ